MGEPSAGAWLVSSGAAISKSPKKAIRGRRRCAEAARLGAAWIPPRWMPSSSILCLMATRRMCVYWISADPCSSWKDALRIAGFASCEETVRSTWRTLESASTGVSIEIACSRTSAFLS